MDSSEDAAGTERRPALSPARRRSLAVALRVAISGAALFILFRLTDPAALRSVFARADVGLLTAAAAALSAIPALTALRWMLACRASGGGLPYFAHLRMTFVSSFLGQALPTSVGVEAVRIFLFARESGSVGRAVAGVVADRLSGVVALLGLTAAAFPLHAATVADANGRAITGAMSALSLCALAAFFAFASPFGAKAVGLLPFAPLRRFAADLRRAFEKPVSTARLVGVSLASYGVTIAGLWLISSALGAEISPLTLFVLAPPAFAVLLLPISVAGWGLRESGFVLFLGFAGVARESALALSLIFGATMLVVSLPGAIVYAAARRRSARRAGGVDDA